MEVVSLSILLFDGFDWTETNIKKVQKHGLSILEIESLFANSLLVLKDMKHSHTEERFIGIGKCITGRTAYAAFTYREKEGQILLRVISARFTHQKESNRYEEFKKNFQEKNRCRR